MIYYLFNKKEQMELESLLANEMIKVDKMLCNIELTDRRDLIKQRALKERKEILICLKNKLSVHNKKSLNL